MANRWILYNNDYYSDCREQNTIGKQAKSGKVRFFAKNKAGYLVNERLPVSTWSFYREKKNL